MKKVLFITNIPSPYRIDFFNEWGKSVDLTVLFEAKTARRYGVRFNWNLDTVHNFRAVFLSEGDINEEKIDKSIFRYLKKGEYDEIIATNYSYRTEMAGIIYMKLHRIPYYIETDGGIVRKENFLKRLFKKFLISGAKGYFSPSVSSDDYLVFYGAKREKIYRYPFTSLYQKDILPSALSLQEKTVYRQKLGMTEKNIVLSVGQFIYRKGYDVLLKACEKLTKETGVYIVGGNATEQYIYLKKELGLDNVHFVGFKDKETLADYYKAADIFVHPTREDIWGLVINEAMAYGLPVITTENCVAGLALVEKDENGYIVPVEDVKALGDSINKVFAGNNRIRMGEESLKRIAPYTFENMARIHTEQVQE